MTATYRPIAFVLNGARTSLRVHPLKRLLDVLREDCGLTGTKEGCGEGECGACTVIVNGKAVNSCLVPAAQVEGARVMTIEGLRGRHRLQRAFAEFGGAQCGICTPGMILAAVALGPHPTLEQVRAGLAGNICRCTGYEGIYRAIRAADRGAEAPRLRKTTGTRHRPTASPSLLRSPGASAPGSPKAHGAAAPSPSRGAEAPRLRKKTPASKSARRQA